MGTGWAALLTFLAAVGIVGAFAWAVQEAAEPVAARLPEYMEEPRRMMTELRVWASERGIPVPAEGTGLEARIESVIRSLARSTASLAMGIVLALAFFVLALLEVHDFRTKLSRASGRHEGWRDAMRRVVKGVQRYIVVRTGVGLVTGLGTGLIAWAIGIEHAVIWGILNFLLNYIPTLGSIVAVFPPVLFALGQYGTAKAVLALVGIGGVQLLMGNYVDPLVQGRYLKLSPVVVLFSVAFWGWVWGIVGAFIGIPLTLGVVIAADQFEESRWIATLLADRPGEDEGSGDSTEDVGGGESPPGHG